MNIYAKAPGLYVNIEKTKVVWIGYEKGSNRRFCEEHNLSWESDEFTVLGITFPKHLVDKIEVNYRVKIDEMKKLFLCWSKRILTPVGKITVIKTLALPKINHLIFSLHSPTNKIMGKIQSLFYLWNNGPNKINGVAAASRLSPATLR